MTDSATGVWMIFMLAFGPAMPTGDPAFATEAGCRLYLYAYYRPTIREAFRIKCENALAPIKRTKR
jgi:hypothetical protein